MEALLCILSFFQALLVRLTKIIEVKSRNSKLPPSPPSIPILGHLHLFGGKLPHQSLQELASRYGGLMLLKLGIHNTLVVSSAHAAKELLQTHDQVFSSRPSTIVNNTFGYGGVGVALSPYGDHWRRMRKLCTLELLTAKRVETFQPMRKLEMFLLIRELLRKNFTPVDLSSNLSDITFNMATRMVMNKSYSTGTPAEKEEAIRFKNQIMEAFRIAGSNTLSDYFPYLTWIDSQAKKVKTIHKYLDQYLNKQIADHRKSQQHPCSTSDFLDLMLSVEGLSDTSIKAVCLELLAAGTDTAAVTTEWALAELVKNPELMLRAQVELDEVVGKNRLLDEKDLPKLTYLQAVVKETLRFHPPAPLLAHESTKACVIDNYVIPARTPAIVNVYAIARDPENWEQPLKFDPERFLRQPSRDMRGQSFEYLPFGSGRRICPGILLGITTVQLVLGSLLHAFQWIVPNGEELDMSEGVGLTVSLALPLKLIPSMRLNSQAYA